MIGYNKHWLENLRLLKVVKNDRQQGLITDVEYEAIKQKYAVGFYTPTMFVRIGLFILTCVIILFGDGLLSLIFLSSDVASITGWIFFLGLLTYGGLELIIHSKNHFRSGVDDALLFISACQLVAAFGLLLYSQNENYFTLSLLVFVLNLFFTLRFADMFMSAVCCIAFFASIFFGVEKLGAGGLAAIPFVMMAAAGGLYWLVYKEQKQLANYENCFVMAQIVCLLALYAAGNYYIVQTLSDELNGTTRAIAFGPFFWVWTIALPFVYLGFGITKKDVILLRIGLLLIAAAVITFRTYYHLLPVDVMFVLSGMAILGLIYAVMKYLKPPKHGFTLEEPADAHVMDNLKVESLVVAQTFSHTPAAPDEGIKFGGGDFGGGGSSANF